MPHHVTWGSGFNVLNLASEPDFIATTGPTTGKKAPAQWVVQRVIKLISDCAKEGKVRYIRGLIEDNNNVTWLDKPY